MNKEQNWLTVLSLIIIIEILDKRRFLHPQYFNL
jgi:hypothetical protein